MNHPALGLPPSDLTAGFPDAAERIRGASDRLGARALEVALDRDPAWRDRYGEVSLRQFLRDTEVFLDRIARSVAGNDPGWTREFADWVAPVYRRRRVAMDDLVTLSEGLREAVAAVLAPEERVPASAAIDAAIEVFRAHRRLGGDARKRNRLLEFLYKGA